MVTTVGEGRHEEVVEDVEVALEDVDMLVEGVVGGVKGVAEEPGKGGREEYDVMKKD